MTYWLFFLITKVWRTSASLRSGPPSPSWNIKWWRRHTIVRSHSSRDHCYLPPGTRSTADPHSRDEGFSWSGFKRSRVYNKTLQTSSDLHISANHDRERPSLSCSTRSVAAAQQCHEIAAEERTSERFSSSSSQFRPGQSEFCDHSQLPAEAYGEVIWCGESAEYRGNPIRGS